MDTSEEYVEMCKAAKEVQRRARNGAGDHWYHPEMGEGISIEHQPCLHCDGGMRPALFFDGYGTYLIGETLGPCTWLPTQTQLQEMLEGYGLQTLIDSFDMWFDNEVGRDADGSFDYSSMEQLWLAFVMKEKHNKDWNGKAWKGGENG